MRRTGPRVCFAAVTVGLLLLSVVATSGGGSWEVVRKEAGVAVYQKDVPGRGMPIFKGRTVIRANIYALLAILQDVDQHKTWMHAVSESAEVDREGDLLVTSYNRTEAPWPVSDRDVVIQSRITLDPKSHTILVKFRSIKSAKRPEVDGVVRVPRLRGYYKFTALAQNKTRVEYQVDADPGGSLPDFIAREASEDTPVNSLRNLRKRASQTTGKYKAFRDRWDPAINAKAPQIVPPQK